MKTKTQIIADYNDIVIKTKADNIKMNNYLSDDMMAFKLEYNSEIYNLGLIYQINNIVLNGYDGIKTGFFGQEDTNVKILPFDLWYASLMD